MEGEGGRGRRKGGREDGEGGGEDEGGGKVVFFLELCSKHVQVGPPYQPQVCM